MYYLNVYISDIKYNNGCNFGSGKTDIKLKSLKKTSHQFTNFVR